MSPVKRILADRYELREELGRGRDGEVYLAYDRVLGESVALKAVSIGAERQAHALQSEAELGARLVHPAWVRVLESGSDDGLRFFTMERARGAPVDCSQLSTEEALRVLYLTAEALRDLHGLGRVHADLKPDHLLVERRDAPAGDPVSVKVLDLSLAVEHGSGAPTELVRGSLDFASPAVLSGEPPGPADDLYALGKSLRAGWIRESPETEDARAAGVLDSALTRMTASDRDSAYRSATHLLEDLTRRWPAEAGPLPATLGHLPLLGRERELEALERAHERFVESERPTWTALIGAPGSGKQRLVRTFALGARLKGTPVVVVESLERTAWNRVVNWLRDVHAADAAQVREALTRPAPNGTTDEPGAAGTAGERTTAGDAAHALLAAAQARPLAAVIVASSERPADSRELAELRRAVLGSAAAHPLWIVTADRCEGATHSTWVQETIDVAPLDDGTIAALCGAHLLAPSARVQARLCRHCAGRPGFAESSASAVARASANGELSPRELDRLIHAQLPGDVEQELRGSSGRLSPRAARLASAASAFAGPVPRRVWEHFAVHAPEADEALGELLDARVLERDDATGSLSFRFESQRQLLASEPGGRERHRIALAAWEAGAVGTERALGLARQAIGAGELELARSATLEAAEEALRTDEPERAAEPLLDFLEAFPESAPLAPIWMTLGETQRRRGLLEEARTSYARAAACGEDVDPSFELLSRWGEVLEDLGESEQAREKLEEALECDPDGRVEGFARVCGILGRLEFRRGRAGAAQESYGRGLSVLEAAGAARSLSAASLWNDLGVIAYRTTRFGEAEERHRRALDIREELGDEDGIARSLTNLGSIDLSRGHYRSALERYEASLAIKRRLGNQKLIALTLSNLALLDFWLGNYRSSIDRHEEAQLIRKRIGAAPDRVRSLTHLSNVWHAKGEYARALDHADRAIELAERLGERDPGQIRAQIARIEVACSVGWGERALPEIEAAIAASVDLDYGLGRAILASLRPVALVQAGADLGDEELEAMDEAIEGVRRLGEPRILTRILLRGATLLDDLGRLGARATWIDEAHAIASRLETPALLADANLLRAQLELRSGRSNEASSRLFGVVDDARSMGIPELQWRAYDGLANFHARHGRPDRVALWHHRCIEVFRQVVDRMPDADMREAYMEVVGRKRVLASISDRIDERAR